MFRPEAQKGKISTSKDFELCYLRHQYFRKVDYNPTEDEMRPYNSLIKSQARSTYRVYKNLFTLVGLDIDDIISIGRVHLVSFLGLFALNRLSIDKYAAFVSGHKTKKKRRPNNFDRLSKDKANFMLFLSQRFEELVRICRQKARNIRGVPTEEFCLLHGPNKPPENLNLLLEDHEKFGFKKMDFVSFRAIKKRQPDRSENPFYFAGQWYVAIKLKHKNLTYADLTGAGYDPYDNIHNRTPEQLLFDKVNEEEFEKKKKAFGSFSESRKKSVLMSFIEKNEKDPIFHDEVETARKVLKRIDDKHVNR